jgi:hypothetical protein
MMPHKSFRLTCRAKPVNSGVERLLFGAVLRPLCVANGRNFLATSPAAYGRLLPIGLSS